MTETRGLLGRELNYGRENEGQAACTKSPKYSQAAAPGPRL